LKCFGPDGVHILIPLLNPRSGSVLQNQLTLKLCYLAFCAHFFFEPSLIAAIYPVSLFALALLVNPRPPMTYWSVPNSLPDALNCDWRNGSLATMSHCTSCLAAVVECVQGVFV